MTWTFRFQAGRAVRFAYAARPLFSILLLVFGNAVSAADTQAPTAPTGLLASRKSSKRIDLVWNAATDNVGIRGYRVERCAGTRCTSFALVAITAGRRFRNYDAALGAATSFSYRVRAMDTSGNLGGYSATSTVAAAGLTTSVGHPPVISGSPATTVVAGNTFTFTPTASDPDGQTLTFGVTGAPAWANINTATGTLQGMPGAGDVGRVDGIVITASDGTYSASLAAFSLTVVQAASGNATVSWLPPTQRTDGAALTNLAGYEIRYGTSPAVLDRTIALADPGLTRYVVESLPPGTWYFGLIAFDSNRVSSAISSTGSKTIP